LELSGHPQHLLSFFLCTSLCALLSCFLASSSSFFLIRSSSSSWVFFSLCFFHCSSFFFFHFCFVYFCLLLICFSRWFSFFGLLAALSLSLSLSASVCCSRTLSLPPLATPRSPSFLLKVCYLQSLSRALLFDLLWNYIQLQLCEEASFSSAAAVVAWFCGVGINVLFFRSIYAASSSSFLLEQ